MQRFGWLDPSRVPRKHLIKSKETKYEKQKAEFRRNKMKIGELYEWTDKTIKEYLGKTFVVIDLAFGGHYTVRFNHDGSECYMTSSELAYHKNLGSGYEKKTG